MLPVVEMCFQCSRDNVNRVLAKTPWVRGRGRALGMGGPDSRAEKIPGRAPGMLAYAATGSAAGAGVVSVWVAGRAGLVTPAMNLSTSLIALSMGRQGSERTSLWVVRVTTK